MVVFGGGIIPDADIPELTSIGVAKVFTPGATTQSIVDWVREHVGHPGRLNPTTRAPTRPRRRRSWS